MTFRRGTGGSEPARSRFDGLVREHLHSLHGFVRVVYPFADADEVVNAAFASAWNRLDEIAAGSERTWLRASARYHVLHHSRAERRWRALNDRVAQLLPVRAVPPLDSEAVVDLDLVMRAIGSLSAPDRELLLMTAVEDLDADDLAVILAISPHAATMRLSRARSRLRAVIEHADANESKGAER